MLYLIIGFVCVIILVVTFTLRVGERNSNAGERQIRNLSGSEIITLLFDKAKTLRKIDGFANYDAAPYLYRSINKCYKTIKSKISSGNPLTDAEKWFYENFYLVYRNVFDRELRLEKLPTSHGSIRILDISRAIVDNSLNSFSIKRIDDVFRSISSVIQLDYSEIISLKKALAIALLEQIYILAKRIVYINDCKKRAFSKRLRFSDIDKDVYIYYLYENSDKSSDIYELLEKKGINEKAVRENFNKTTLHNIDMAETLFCGIKLLSNEYDVSNYLKFTGSYQELKDYDKLKNVSWNTVRMYLSKIYVIARKTKVSEVYVAKKVKELSEKTTLDYSILLLDNAMSVRRFVKGGVYKTRKRIEIGESLYVTAIVIISLGLSVLIGWLLKDIVVGVLTFVPIWFLTENIVNSFLSQIKNRTENPTMSYSDIPYEHSAMIVVSEFITSVEQLKESIFHAKSLLDGNKDDNLYVSLLIDTKPSALLQSDLDNDIINYLSNSILDSNFNVFLRKKVYNGKNYSAHERKRGAITALNKFLIHKQDYEFAYIYNKTVLTPRYIIVLDADNTLMPGEAKRLINVMAHPYNEKYDLMTLKAKYSLFSIKNLYNYRFCLESGSEAYPYYGDLYYRLFNKAIFCGKGIYRLKSFYNQLEELLPEKKVLSHDILEGSVLTTGCAGMCFEDAPESFIADRERRKRWLRGDVQLLPFLFGNMNRANGEKNKVKISVINKYVMIKNVFFALKDSFLLALIYYCFSSHINNLIFLGALLIAPTLFSLIGIIKGGFSGDTAKRTFQKLNVAMADSLEKMLLIPYYAISNLTVICCTFGRMITKKNLLEWKTYYSSQKTKGFKKHAAELLPSLIINTAIGILLAIFTATGVYVSIYLGVFVIYYILQYCFSLVDICSTYKNEHLIDKAKEYAYATYKFFGYMRNPGRLIGDNLQINPYKGEAKTTSPTNIGFALLAEFCAYSLGFINYEECIKNLSDLLTVVEKLKRWNGLYYNWYRISDNAPVNDFVSSVDNGNLAMALLIIREFLKSKDENFLFLKIDLTLRGIRFENIYDSNKRLFYIGCFGEKKSGHYDLLASEARILSFVYIALYNDVDHFEALSKDYLSRNGNILLSWSGTMFEQLMPDIFFDFPKYSVMRETNKYNVLYQSRHRINGLWGVSESGYYAFDDNLLYQYKAYGMDFLSLAGNTYAKVISPYSSALGISYYPKKAIANLDLLKEKGLLGEYGFYESVDYRKKEKIVYSFMTHHQGMILASLTNYICDDVIKKTLLKSSKFYAVKAYYDCLQPSERYIGKRENERKRLVSDNSGYRLFYNDVLSDKKGCVLTDGNYTVVRNAIGGGFSSFGKRYMNVYSSSYTDCNGFYFFAKIRDEWVTPTYLPFGKNAEDFRFGYTDREAYFSNIRYDITETSAILPMMNGEVRKIVFDNAVKKISFYGRIALAENDEFLAHPTFNDMFVSVTQIDAETVVFEKKIRGEKGKSVYLAIRVFGLENVEMNCNRMNFIGRNGSIATSRFLDNKNKDYAALGDVLAPCAGITGNPKKNECQIVILYGENVKELTNTIRDIPQDPYRFALQIKNHVTVCKETNSLLACIVYGKYPSGLLNNVMQSGSNNRFNDFRQGCKPICFKYSGNINAVNKLCDVIDDLRYVNERIKVIVYTNQKLFASEIAMIAEIFEKHNVIYEFVNGTAEKRYWGMLELKDDFIVEKEPLETSELFEIERLPSSFSGEYIAPKVQYRTGRGGYDEDGNYICFGGKTELPYTDVIGMEEGGVIVTADGGGFFYFGNSRENKCVEFDNDFVSTKGGEFAYLRSYDKVISLFGGSESYAYSIIGRGFYKRVINADDFSSVTETGCILDGKIKYSSFHISRKTNDFTKIVYGLKPCLGWKSVPSLTSWARFDDVCVIFNVENNKKLYVRFLYDKPENLTFIEKDCYPLWEIYVDGETCDAIVVCSEDLGMIKSITKSNFAFFKQETKDYFSAYERVKIETDEKSLDYLLSYLPYQIVSSRLNAKAGFYQVGGATGFRDQLQDTFAFQFDADLIKKQIIECCERQYEEGDVMHWWHKEKFGLRTRITDDKLFLPLAVCEYIEKTRDDEILKTELRYLKSQPLSPREKDRFENPPYTEYRESVFKHCLRAIRSSLKYGEHKLLIMGSGDWNDGMDYVCSKGKGESVFNSMFCYYVITEFAKLCPQDLANEMNVIATELKNALNLHAWDNDRYKRLFSDSGKWLGSEKSDGLKLDLLTQCFAVISGVADGERATKCLETASKLVDKKGMCIRLLTPPLDKKCYLGYISDYPAGIRENGGQYTHAAMWYLMSLCKVGKEDEAFELFQLINPVEKCREHADIYKGEPYVLSGDVYTNKFNFGRMGWSYYTGSAAWAYKLIVEYFFGINRKGDYIQVNAYLPKKLEGATLTLNYKNSVYKMKYTRGLVNKIVIDGEEADAIKLETNVNRNIVVQVGL